MEINARYCIVFRVYDRRKAPDVSVWFVHFKNTHYIYTLVYLYIISFFICIIYLFLFYTFIPFLLTFIHCIFIFCLLFTVITHLFHSFIPPSICPSTHQFILHPSAWIHSFIYSSIHLLIHLFLHPSAHLPIHPSIYLLIHSFIHLYLQRHN